MPSYKVSNKPWMYFCVNNVICSIHACLLKAIIHLLNNYALVFTL